MKFHLQEGEDPYKIFIDKFKKESLSFQISNKICLIPCNIKTTQPCENFSSATSQSSCLLIEITNNYGGTSSFSNYTFRIILAVGACYATHSLYSSVKKFHEV